MSRCYVVTSVRVFMITVKDQHLFDNAKSRLRALNHVSEMVSCSIKHHLNCSGKHPTTLQLKRDDYS